MRLALLLCVMLVGCAGAYAATWKDGVTIPPKAFDHAPTVPFIVLHLHPSDLEAICPHTASCSIPIINGKCAVLLPDWREVATSFAGTAAPRFPDALMREHLLRHEYAHCNGWRHT